MKTATKLDFHEWLEAVKAALIAAGFSGRDAHNYVFDNTPDWREFYDDGYSPADAVREDLNAGAD